MARLTVCARCRYGVVDTRSYKCLLSQLGMQEACTGEGRRGGGGRGGRHMRGEWEDEQRKTGIRGGGGVERGGRC